MRTEIDAAAAHLKAERDSLVARRARSPPSSPAPVPLIYGCELTAPVAYRWKCQVNENAKQHAFEHELPELDHNEIVGWDERRPARPSRRSSSATATSTRGSASAPS